MVALLCIVVGLVSVLIILGLNEPWFMESVSEETKSCMINWTSINVSTSGQGDAHIITVNDKESMLIDAGTKAQGQSIVVPFLKSSNIKKIDYAVISHTHKDHYGGMGDVSESLTIENLIVHEPTVASCNTEKPSWGCNFDHYYPFKKTIKRKKNIDPDLGVIVGTDFCGVELIHKYDGENGVIGKVTDVNNATGIYRINANGNTALLTADIGKITGDYLASNLPEKADVDVYKYPHHGATHHAGKKLLDAASPLSIMVPAPVWLTTHERGVEAFLHHKQTPEKSFWNGLDGSVTYTFTHEGIWACADVHKHSACKGWRIK